MRNSPTGQLWQYPLSHPSNRFTRFNNLVRDLDRRFRDLPTHGKREWARWSTIWPHSVFCLPGIFHDEPPPEFQRWAIASYQNVNCTRIEQGLPVSDAVPLLVTSRENDSILPEGSVSFSVFWDGRVSAPVGPCTCSVYARGLNHPAESGPAIQAMRFQFLEPIVYGASFDVSRVFSVPSGFAGLPFTALAYVVADLGGFPIFGGRQGFYRDGSPG